MNISKAISRLFKSMSMFTLLLYLMADAVPVMAQSAPAKARPVVTIDGALEPDRIPDWILWRELFQIATIMSEQAPDSGRDLWMNQLRLSQQQMDDLVARGRSFKDEEALMIRGAKLIDTGNNGALSETAWGKLRQLRLDNEKLVLTYRNRLAEAIGDEAIRKMQSFARLHIAPSFRLGEIELPDRK